MESKNSGAEFDISCNLINDGASPSRILKDCPAKQPMSTVESKETVPSMVSRSSGGGRLWQNEPDDHVAFDKELTNLDFNRTKTDEFQVRGKKQIQYSKFEDIATFYDVNKYKFVTPFSNYLTYYPSLLNKTSELSPSSRTECIFSPKNSIRGWTSASPVFNTPVISRSSVGETSTGDTPEPDQDHLPDEVGDTPACIACTDIADYESSSYFPVMFHRMLTAVARVDSTFMRWCSEGTGFVIDYSLSDETMSNIIKPYFKHGQYQSLRRQLNAYGFKKGRTGGGLGVWKHPLFTIDSSFEDLNGIRAKSKKRWATDGTFNADTISESQPNVFINQASPLATKKKSKTTKQRFTVSEPRLTGRAYKIRKTRQKQKRRKCGKKRKSEAVFPDSPLKKEQDNLARNIGLDKEHNESKFSVTDNCIEKFDRIYIDEAVKANDSIEVYQSRHEKRMPQLHQVWSESPLQPENVKNHFRQKLDSKYQPTQLSVELLDSRSSPSGMHAMREYEEHFIFHTGFDGAETDNFSPRPYGFQGQGLELERPGPNNFNTVVETLRNRLFTPVITNTERLNYPSPACMGAFGNLIELLDEAQTTEQPSEPHP